MACDIRIVKRMEKKLILQIHLLIDWSRILISWTKRKMTTSCRSKGSIMFQATFLNYSQEKETNYYHTMKRNWICLLNLEEKEGYV